VSQCRIRKAVHDFGRVDILKNKDVRLFRISIGPRYSGTKELLKGAQSSRHQHHDLNKWDLHHSSAFQSLRLLRDCGTQRHMRNTCPLFLPMPIESALSACRLAIGFEFSDPALEASVPQPSPDHDLLNNLAYFAGRLYQECIRTIFCQLARC
jgi:hypothetical protein